MAGPESSFDVVAERYKEYEESLSGYIRYEVSHRFLKPYLSNEPKDHKEIADIGGGSGIDAIWLAGMGHRVLLADISTRHLDRAQDRLSRQPAEVRERILLFNGTAEQLLEHRGIPRFDMVLSHCVAMYQESPASYIQRVTPLVRPGGALSIIEPSYLGAAAHFIRNQNWDAIVQLRTEQNVIDPNEGVAAHAFKRTELDKIIREAMKVMPGNVGLQCFGVGVSTDSHSRFTRPEEFSPYDLRTLVDVEFEIGKNKDTRGASQFWQFVAEKALDADQ